MKILLATLHAKYVHASLALPYLAVACAGVPEVETVIREYTVNEPADKVLRSLVAEAADLVAFSCYIWNLEATLRLAADLKQVLPGTVVILGGPEAAHGVFALLHDNPAIDMVVRGEGEGTFPACVERLREHRGSGTLPSLAAIAGLSWCNGEEIIANPERETIADLDTIPSPFAAGLVDCAKPLVYYESSRGCPFSCAFCMSSLEKGVRTFSSQRIETDLTILMARGVQTIKFVDRTFNFDPGRANEIWRFILRHNQPSRCHFEIAADLLTEENIALLRQVPPGLFRFEIGVQSGEEATLAQVGRKSDLARLFANVRRLLEETGVVIHLDLVAGLPGEDFAGFLGSLQGLIDVHPQHIQVELLKVLKGSPMRRIAAQEGYAYSAFPPYTILHNPWLSFQEVSGIGTIARLLDLYYNSGRYGVALAVLSATIPLAQFFAALANWWEAQSTLVGLSQTALFEILWAFAAGHLDGDVLSPFRDALCYDFCLADYPVSSRLPAFFQVHEVMTKRDKGKDHVADVARRLAIAEGSRVRTFRWRFQRNYSCPGQDSGPVELLFVYVSAPGRGMEVRVLVGE